jgi:hypothetical protein
MTLAELCCGCILGIIFCLPSAWSRPPLARLPMCSECKTLLAAIVGCNGNLIKALNFGILTGWFVDCVAVVAISILFRVVHTVRTPPTAPPTIVLLIERSRISALFCGKSKYFFGFLSTQHKPYHPNLKANNSKMITTKIIGQIFKVCRSSFSRKWLPPTCESFHEYESTYTAPSLIQQFNNFFLNDDITLLIIIIHYEILSTNSKILTG